MLASENGNYIEKRTGKRNLTWFQQLSGLFDNGPYIIGKEDHKIEDCILILFLLAYNFKKMKLKTIRLNIAGPTKPCEENI